MVDARIIGLDSSGGKGYSKGKPVVRATNGLVASGHYLTSMAGMEQLLSGGNAFDAAVAAGFAAAVIEPTAFYSLASEASILLYDARNRQVRALSGQGTAPRRATPDLFAQKGLATVPAGPGPDSELSFTVPGAVDALILLLETYGTRTLAEVLAPAIGHARRGVPLYEIMQKRVYFAQTQEQFRRYPPGGVGVYSPGGKDLELGQPVVQEKLADILTKLVEAESRAGGDRVSGLRAAREMFYRGDVARTIAGCSDSVGGLLGMDDLGGYSATFDDPIATTYMGHEVHTQSVWTQGAVLLQALNILEHFDLRAMGHNSPGYIHTVIEAVKLAFADREKYYGDPDFVKVPLDGLLSKDYATARAGLVQSDGAWPEMPQHGDPWKYSNGVTAGVARSSAPAPRDGDSQSESDTTHLAVIDNTGNIVCATPSGGAYWRSVFFPDLGCTLSTRSEIFSLEPGHPNVLEPGKRPRTTLVNYILLKDGEPVMTLGCPGGDNQVQACLQMLLNVMVFGMDPQEAVEATRFGTMSMPGSFHPHVYAPGQLQVEPGIPEDVRSQLAGLGHEIAEVPACGSGAIVCQRDPETGVMSAGADSRKMMTYAIGW